MVGDAFGNGSITSMRWPLGSAHLEGQVHFEGHTI